MSTAPPTNQELLARRQAAVPRGPFHVTPIFAERAENSKIWDVEGREYIDFAGGIGVINVGHNHPRVVAAIKAQADKFIHTCFHVTMYEEYIRLAERLNALVPIADECKTVLFNSGAEASENAIKISRYYTKRQGVVAFERGFHGRTLMGMTLTGKCKPYSQGFGPFAPEVYRLPYMPFFATHHELSDAEVEAQSHEAIDHLFAYHIEPENIACLIVEPILGEGGFRPLNCVAAKILHTRFKEIGALFIADEVQSGFARSGAMFAIERYKLEPDMIAMAKSLAGGMVLSGVTGRAEIMDAPHAGGIGGTYGGNPLSCAAANAVLDIMEEENLPERANRIGEKILAKFAELHKRHDFVAEPRGLGAMCALELVIPGTRKPDIAKAIAVCAKAFERGLIVMSASGNVIRTLMPITIPDEDLDKGLEILAQTVADV